MVIIEQLVAPNAHSHNIDAPLPMHKTSDARVEFDVELDETESSRQSQFASVNDADIQSQAPGNERAFSLLLGLVIHGVADGFALGVASLARNKDGDPNPVSFIVFLALMLHKGNSPIVPMYSLSVNSMLLLAPTALAFTTSLLSNNLPRPICKKYVGIFSASTPLSAIASCLTFRVLGSDNHGNVTGTALLISVSFIQ